VQPLTLLGAAMIVGACLLAATRRRPDVGGEVESGVPGGV